MKAFLIKNLKRLIEKAYRKVKFIAEQSEWNDTRLKFKHIGDNSFISTPRIIVNPQLISIGDNLFTLYNTRIEAVTSYAGRNYSPHISIGNNVSINSDCHIGSIDSVHIGNDVLIASRVYISDHSHGEIGEESFLLPPNKRPLFSKGPVVIGDNVWIGEGVCILPGVTIGNNAIIGANSVVTKHIPANAIAAGVPAVVIRIVA